MVLVIPLTVNSSLEDSEHIRHWTRLVEKGKRQTESEKKKDRVPRKQRLPTSALYFIVGFKLFFFDFPPARIEETTQGCMSWRYIKVTELVELLWRRRSSGAALSACSINSQLREEKTKGTNEITLIFSHDYFMWDDWYQNILKLVIASLLFLSFILSFLLRLLTLYLAV